MTVSEQLRERAAKMRHAISRDVIIDDKGHVEQKREFHYLSCVRCELEREASELEKLEEKNGTK